MDVKSLVTAEELLKMGDIGRCELVKGEIIRMSPAGHARGRIAVGANLVFAHERERERER